MPPKASTSAGSAPRRPNAGGQGNSSTLNADGQPKRKRTRGRGGRGRGGRGKKESSDESSSSDSSDGNSSGDEDKPVASTSKIATTSSPAKSKTAAQASGASSKSKAKGKATGEASSAEDSDNDGSSSDSSSSSSSFLTTSDEDEEVPTPRVRPQAQQGSRADGLTYAQSQLDGFQGQGQSQNGEVHTKRPEMTRPNDPPYIQFGADADATANIRAFGKPILWGLLPGDVPAISSPTLNDDEDQDDRMKAIVEQEKVKAEEKYLKFREDYVSKMITRFGSSLDQIRVKEGDTMKESRLKVLIDSIALGADTFTSKDGEGIWRVKQGMGEREVVLEGLELLDARQKDDDEMGNS